MKRNDILDAYIFLRKHNNSIPDEVLDFMKGASLREYDKMFSGEKINPPPLT